MTKHPILYTLLWIYVLGIVILLVQEVRTRFKNLYRPNRWKGFLVDFILKVSWPIVYPFVVYMVIRDSWRVAMIRKSQAERSLIAACNGMEKTLWNAVNETERRHTDLLGRFSVLVGYTHHKDTCPKAWEEGATEECTCGLEALINAAR